MKANLRTLAALTLFTASLSGVALAQSYEHNVRASIPFNFYAGNKLQHAGTYLFAINLESGNVAIVFRENNTGWFLQGAPEDGSKRAIALLTFRTDGRNIYVLEKIQWPDFGASFDVKKVPGDVVENRSADSTETVVAQLVR